MALKFLILLGSVRDGRQGIKVAKYILKRVEDAGHEVELIDPLELDLPLVKQPLQFYPDQSQAPPILLELNQKIRDADAYIVVSAEYNRNIPPALANLLDHFPPNSFGFKTSSIVTYSMGRGGGMVGVVLRAMLCEFGAAPVPYLLNFQEVQNSFDDDGNPKKDSDKLSASLAKMLKQLEWYGNALRNHRQTFGIPKWGAVLSV